MVFQILFFFVAQMLFVMTYTVTINTLKLTSESLVIIPFLLMFEAIILVIQPLITFQ